MRIFVVVQVAAVCLKGAGAQSHADCTAVGGESGEARPAARRKRRFRPKTRGTSDACLRVGAIRLATRMEPMKPRTLALATFVALFGATASFGAFANDEQPIDETAPVAGQSLDPADPATTPEELYETDRSLAAEEMDDDDDDADDDADDDDAVDDATDDAAAEAAAATGNEAAAGDATMSQTTAATTIAPADAQARRAQGDVARQDSNSNGTLEASELSSKSELTLRFDEFDADDNGSLTANEYQGWLAAHADPGTSGATAASATSSSSTLTTTTTTTTEAEDATVMSSSNEDDPALASEEVSGEVDRPSDAGTPDVDSSDDRTAGLTAQSAEEAEETESEDVSGEDERPSDAGTPDVDSDEEEADDLDDNDD
jgi:hypothetical protein